MGLIFVVLRFDYGSSWEIGVLIRVPKGGNLVGGFLLLQFKKFQVLKFHLKIPEHSTLTSKREWSAVKLQQKWNLPYSEDVCLRTKQFPFHFKVTQL